MRYSLAIAALAAAAPVVAAPNCALPATIAAPEKDPGGEARTVPIGGYLLTLSWSPEYCFNAKRNGRGDGGARDDLQCGSSNRFAFTLHGLWPEGRDATWPQYCKSVPLVAPSTVRGMLCRTPSVSLIEHEWEKHGSCHWATPEAYFAQSSALMDKIKLPDLSGLTRGQVNASAIRAAFTTLNRNLPYKAIGIATNKSGWFEEVRLCLDTNFNFHACPAYSYGTADGEKVKVARLR